MSNPSLPPELPPDPAFDALMAQTEALRQRYARATAAEEPSAAIDARIRAAAWQAAGVTSTPTSRSWGRRLRVPVSIAAVLALTMSAMLSMLRDTGERSLPDPSPPMARAPATPMPTVVADATAPADDARTAMAGGDRNGPARSPIDNLKSIERRQPSDSASGQRARSEVVAAAGPRAAPRIDEAASAPAAVPSPPAVATGRDATARDRREQTAESDLNPAAPVTLAKAARVEPSVWLERIRRQWISGAHEAASQQLAAFRQAHPAYAIAKDFPVPLPPVVPER